MNRPLGVAEIAQSDALEHAVQRACALIAPTWPLDGSVAVNPWWGHIDQPISQVAARLLLLSGARLLMPRAFYRAHWRAGDVRREHLQAAIDVAGAGQRVDDMVAALDVESAPPPPLPLLCDAVDARRELRHHMAWRHFLIHQISQYCAAYFDRAQAIWTPSRAAGLYAGWRRSICEDHSARLLMGRSQIMERARRLPKQAMDLIRMAIAELDVPEADLEDYLLALLLNVNGWASWCAYQHWQARLQGADDTQITELLAIRLAWDWLLDDGRRGTGSRHADWRGAWSRRAALLTRTRTQMEIDWLLQRALEFAEHGALCAGLTGAVPAAEPAPEVQAVFCIDVREEVFRRALENVSPALRTLGFAGFFGLPLSYQPLGTPLSRPQLPGLLAPASEAADVADDAGQTATIAERRRRRLQWASGWQGFRNVAASSFTYIESLGLTYAGKLLRHSLAHQHVPPPIDGTGLSPAERARLRPRLQVTPENFETHCEQLAGLLPVMGLTTEFARMVLLAGHGSHSANNPFASALDCGACAGQTGEVNVRVLAALLNDPEIRAGLAARGIVIPSATWFVAGLHDTTTDECTLFDIDLAPEAHHGDLERLRLWLQQAGETARAERAPALALEGLVREPQRLQEALRQRANDWAQVRPEWGLTGNAVMIAAPRWRSRHLNLAGRAFLHEYDWRRDPSRAVLTQIMTAPMVVAHWINMQYYASTVDNRHYGSGNKVLHNVVGGRIGVFEGNGGDLRIGLPWQSLHDGQRLRHQPLRLAVFIEAPQAAIDEVLAGQPTVRRLLDNGWLHLSRIDSDSGALSLYRDGVWQPWPHLPSMTRSHHAA